MAITVIRTEPATTCHRGSVRPNSVTLVSPRQRGFLRWLHADKNTIENDRQHHDGEASVQPLADVQRVERVEDDPPESTHADE